MMKYFVVGLCLLSLVFADQEGVGRIRFGLKDKCVRGEENCNKRRLLLEGNREEHAVREETGPQDRKLLGDSSQVDGHSSSGQEAKRWMTTSSSGGQAGDRKLLAKKTGLVRVKSNGVPMIDVEQIARDRKLLGDPLQETRVHEDMLNQGAIARDRKLLGDPLQVEETSFSSDSTPQQLERYDANRDVRP